MHDLTNRKFGRLTALEKAGSNKSKHVMWRCKCECGNEVVVSSDGLLNGGTKSCGCLQKEMQIIANTKHGYCGTRLYRIWKGVKSRCNIKSSTDYKWYGALGVTVCEEWDKFVPFKDWALANGYSEELTLDRIDTYGNYCPYNCRWATIKEQNLNKRETK